MTAKQKAQARNHPKKGSSIKVEPIKAPEDIDKISKLLKDNPRDLCIFDIGISTNLRAKDLTNLRVGQIRHLHVGDELVLKESKTGKHRRITVNEDVYLAVRNLLSTMPDADDDDLRPGCDGSLCVEVVVEPIVERRPEDRPHGVGQWDEIEKRKEPPKAAPHAVHRDRHSCPRACTRSS